MSLRSSSRSPRRRFLRGRAGGVFALLWLAVPSTFPVAFQNTAPSTSAETLQKHYDAARSFYAGGDLERATGEYNGFLANALHSLANAHSNAREFERSRALFEQGLKLAPDDEGLRLDYALSCFQQGKLPEAGALAAKVAQSRTDNAKARALLGQILFAQGDYKGAREQLEAAVVATPNFEVGYLLGLSYIKLNDLTQARLLFDDMVRGLGDSPQIHILFGRAYAKGEWEALDQAIAELKKAIAKDPSFRGAHYFLGLAYLTRDGESSFPNVVPELQAELKNNPDDSRSHYLLGYIAMKEHDAKTAEKELMRAAALDPHNPDPLIYLGQLYADADRDEEAETMMRKAIAMSGNARPDDFLISRAHYVLGRLLVKKGQRDEGQKELEISKDLRDHLNHPNRAPNQKGQKFADAASFSEGSDEALPDASKAVSSELEKQAQALEEELKPSISDAYNNLGVIAAQKKQFDSATDYFKQTAEWNPSLATLDRNWGMAAFYANQYEQAIPPLTRQLTREVGDVRVRAALGLSQFMVLNYAKVVEILRPISSEVDSDPGLSYAYSVSLVKTGNYDEGVRRLKSLDVTGTHAAEIHMLLGQAFADQQDYSAAIEEYRKSLTIDPNQAATHYYNGIALLREGQLSEAADEFRTSLKLQPGDVRVKYHLAFALIQAQQKDKGILLLNEVIRADPGYADAYYELGKIQLEQRDTKAAISSLETGAKLSPGSDYIHYQLAMAYRRELRISDAERELKIYQELKNKRRGREVSQ